MECGVESLCKRPHSMKGNGTLVTLLDGEMKPWSQFLAVGVLAALMLTFSYNFSRDHVRSINYCVDATEARRADWTSSNGTDDTDSGLSSEENFMERVRSRMEERKRHLRETCEKLGLRHNMNKIRTGLIFSEQYKTIFCQIPKTGITQWKHLFTDMTDAGLKDDHFEVDFRKMFQVTKGDKLDILSQTESFKMTVVREPMERLVSAFRSKLEGSGTTLWGKAKQIHEEYGNKTDPDFANQTTPDFSTFVNYLVLNYPDSLYKDEMHWKTFATLCQPCDFDYDVIGHQETIDEDSEFILRTIGASPDLKLRPPYQNKTDDDMVLRYYSSVKPRDRVLQLYHLLLDDYLLFGYPPPPFLKQLFHAN